MPEEDSSLSGDVSSGDSLGTLILTTPKPAAGYLLHDGRLVDARGAPLAFEILVKNRDKERLTLACARNLVRLGVAVNARSTRCPQVGARRRSEYNRRAEFRGA